MTTQPVLVVNADDFGLTPGVCRGILHAHDHGIVTSTSVLVGAPAFEAHAPSLRDSDLGVGLHLCLVGEDPPLLSAAEIPTLVERDGRLPSDWRRFLRRAALGRLDPDDISRELTTQAEKAADAGLRLGHLDAHQNLQLWPPVGAIAIDLARALGVDVLRVTSSDRWGPTGIGVRVLGARLRRAARAAGVVVPDHAAGLDSAGHLSGTTLFAEIADLGKRAGHADLAVHPGLPDDPDRSRYRWGYEWGAELEALCSPAASAAVRAAGFRLGDFADLARAARG